MKKWLETDSFEEAFDKFNDNADEIEQGFDNRYTKQEVDNSLDLKANKQQEEWITPTLLNGWTEFGTGYETVKYMKDQFGFIHLKGMVKGGVLGESIFILPIGYRPNLTQLFPLNSNGAFGNGAITSIGSVSLYNGSNTYVSLNGITFKVV